MKKTIRTGSTVATIALALIVGLCTAQNVQAQASDDALNRLGAIGARALASEMGIPSHAMTVDEAYMDVESYDGNPIRLEIDYVVGGVYECRMIGAIAMALAATRQTSLDAEITCPDHKVYLDVDIGYSGLEYFKILQRDRSTGALIYSESGTG